MRPPQHRTVSQRRLVWLLWLALLVPVAQASASWHALSHAHAEAAGDVDGKQALHHGKVELCQIGAALACGALPAEPTLPPPPAARHEAPHADAISVRLALPTPAYQSRAPPFAQL